MFFRPIILQTCYDANKHTKGMRVCFSSAFCFFFLFLFFFFSGSTSDWTQDSHLLGKCSPTWTMIPASPLPFEQFLPNIPIYIKLQKALKSKENTVQVTEHKFVTFNCLLLFIRYVYNSTFVWLPFILADWSILFEN